MDTTRSFGIDSDLADAPHNTDGVAWKLDEFVRVFQSTLIPSMSITSITPHTQNPRDNHVCTCALSWADVGSDGLKVFDDLLPSVMEACGLKLVSRYTLFVSTQRPFVTDDSTGEDTEDDPTESERVSTLRDESSFSNSRAATFRVFIPMGCTNPGFTDGMDDEAARSAVHRAANELCTTISQNYSQGVLRSENTLAEKRSHGSHLSQFDFQRLMSTVGRLRRLMMYASIICFCVWLFLSDAEYAQVTRDTHDLMCYINPIRRFEWFPSLVPPCYPSRGRIEILRSILSQVLHISNSTTTARDIRRSDATRDPDTASHTTDSDRTISQKSGEATTYNPLVSLVHKLKYAMTQSNAPSDSAKPAEKGTATASTK